MNRLRSCGECVACCKTHGVPALGKPAQTWCVHCDHGENPKRGCRAYSERPESCREFKCAWLQGLIPDDASPLKLGVVFSIGNAHTILVSEFKEHAFEQERVKALATAVGKVFHVVVQHSNGDASAWVTE